MPVSTEPNFCLGVNKKGTTYVIVIVHDQVRSDLLVVSRGVERIYLLSKWRTEQVRLQAEIQVPVKLKGTDSLSAMDGFDVIRQMRDDIVFGPVGALDGGPYPGGRRALPDGTHSGIESSSWIG